MNARAGISFLFNTRADLQVAETFLDCLFPQAFAEGKMEVLREEQSIGFAGKLTAEQIASIPAGARLNMVAKLNDDQIETLKTEIENVNVGIDFRERTLRPAFVLDA